MPLPLPPRHVRDATMFSLSSCRRCCCRITAAVAKPIFRCHCRCLCRITSISPPPCCFCQAKFALPPLSMPSCRYCYRHLLSKFALPPYFFCRLASAVTFVSTLLPPSQVFSAIFLTSCFFPATATKPSFRLCCCWRLAYTTVTRSCGLH